MDQVKPLVNPLDLEVRLPYPNPSMWSDVPSVLQKMKGTGFQGRALAESVDIWKQMADENCFITLGYAGSLSSVGLWRIVCWLVENGFVHAVVSTGANITEDVLDSMCQKAQSPGYRQVDPWRVDDEKLLHSELFRFYDHVVSDSEYCAMEKLLADFMVWYSVDAYKVNSGKHLMEKFGQYLDSLDLDSIARSCYRKGVPLFVPALPDCGFGVAFHNMPVDKRPLVDFFEDFVILTDLMDVTIKQGRPTGVVYLGGGVPKDFTQITTTSLSYRYDKLFPHKYSIQYTTDNPVWGGLSGCTTTAEALSWGKESPDGKNSMVFCDATIALPFVAEALARHYGLE